jgi:hypothetical protein
VVPAHLFPFLFFLVSLFLLLVGLNLGMPKYEIRHTDTVGLTKGMSQAEWVARLLRIWEVLSSNLVPETGYPD